MLTKNGSDEKNEIMFNDGIAPEAIKMVSVPNRWYRDEIVDHLRQKGVKKINGIDVEKFVRFSTSDEDGPNLW